MTSNDEQLLFALYEFENARPRVLSYLDRAYEDPAVQHCVDQAKHHPKLVHELLEPAVPNSNSSLKVCILSNALEKLSIVISSASYSF